MGYKTLKSYSMGGWLNLMNIQINLRFLSNVDLSLSLFQADGEEELYSTSFEFLLKTDLCLF